MISINLLPKEVRPKGYVLKVKKSLKKAIIALFIVFLISASIVMGALIVLSNKTKESSEEHERLKKEIIALEQTEQRLFLVRDRLEKISKVLETGNASDEVIIMEDVVDTLPVGVVFKGAHLKKKSADITVLTNKSSDITEFIQTLIGSQKYRVIRLLSMDFDPEYGYTFSVSLAK
jgi:Tfp pilus assembly protein PilN